MKNDEKGLSKAGSQDRKTRVDGDRVIHTVAGTLFHGDRNEAPRGLTVEQAESQRSGAGLDERQTREAAHGAQQSTPVGDVNRVRARADAVGKGKRDELTEAPFGKHQK